MPKVAPLQNLFTGGEFSPHVEGRVDAERYKTGLKTCKNFLPTIQGPLTRRPGTKFVSEGKNPGATCRLIPFVFSTTQAYILEFGDLYMRVYKDNGLVTLTAQNITGATQANPGVITVTAHGYSNGDRVVILNVGGMVELNNREFIVQGVTANTFTLQNTSGTAVNTTGYTAYTSGGTVAKVYEIVTPYTQAQLAAIQYAQSADVLYLAHSSHHPRQISRTGHTNWTIANFTFKDGPFLNTNTTATYVTPPNIAPGASGALTISSIVGVNNDTGFQTTDVGRLIRFRSNNGTENAEVWCTITARASTTSVTVRNDSAWTVGTPGAAESKGWRLGVIDGTSGYPAAVTLHQGRLWWGGYTAYPQRIDGSMISDFNNYGPSEASDVRDGKFTVTDASAVAFTLASSQVNVIRWLTGEEKGLLIGTAGAEWLVSPSQQGEAISPTNVNARVVSLFGAGTAVPVQLGKGTLYVPRSGRRLRELIYLFEIDGFNSIDLSTLADHLTLSGISTIAPMREPQSIAWIVRSDGVLLACSYDRDTEALRAGWSQHTLGGVGDSGGGAPVVESVAVIPSANGARDELWMVVKRYIGGRTVRYVEYLTRFFEDDIAHEDAVFLDSALTYDGAAVTTVSGLGHLEGATVTVCADGQTRPTATVTNGKITISPAGSVVHVGYAYNSDAQMLRIEAGSATGTALGKTRRKHRVGWFLYRTGAGFKVGPSLTQLAPVIFRTTSDPLSAAVPLFSGIQSETFESDYDFENQIAWRMSDPQPCMILAVAPQMDVQDRQ